MELSIAAEARIIDELSQSIAKESEKLLALESVMLTLEHHSEPLTALQVQMLQLTAEKTGAVLAHTRMGLGLEAWQDGDRQEELRTLTLEGFKETFRKIVDWVLKLLKRIWAWFKTSMDQRRLHLNALDAKLGFRNHEFRFQRPEPEMEAKIAEILALNGSFKPTEVAKNINTTLEALRASSYQNEVVKYGRDVIEIVNKFMNDVEGNNWRRYVEDVCKLSMPIPATFETAGTARTHADYQSLPLLHGGRIMFRGVAEGNDHGARGARARAEALAHVHEEHAAATEAIGGLTEVRNFALTDHVYKDARRIVLDCTKNASALITQSAHFLSSLERTESDLKKIHDEKMEHMTADASAIVGNLIRSLGSQSQLSLRLINTAIGQAIGLGNIFTHLEGFRH